MTTQRSLGPFSVFPIGLGAMPLSFGGEKAVPRERAVAVIHAALDAGVTLIDTADIYAPSWDAMGHNELVVAEALASYPGDHSGIVVATKGGITRSEGETWGRNGSADYLKAAADKSRERLGVESIDLYYLHRPDRTRLYSEVVATLGQLQADGVIKQIGISNANVEEIQVALDVLGEGGLAAVQNEFSPRFHHTSRDELQFCGEHGIAFLPWSPLGGTGGGAAAVGTRFPAISEVADAHQVSPQRVTLAWELALGDHVIPIPGSSRPESIIDSAQAPRLPLTDDQVAAISASIFGE